MATTPKRAAVILVHGAWADGSSWAKVIDPLLSLNLEVVAAPLPLTALDDDILAVHRAIARTTGPVVLVAHAYAGAVISAIDDDRVRSVVMIAALAPAVGESVADVFFREEPHPKAPNLKPEKDGFIWMSDEGFQAAFAQNAADEEKRVLTAIQRPINIACIQQPVLHTSWSTKPSWYLVAEQDRMIRPTIQRFMAERMGAKIRSVEADHSPSIIAPRAVVEIISEAVTHHEFAAADSRT